LCEKYIKGCFIFCFLAKKGRQISQDSSKPKKKTWDLCKIKMSLKGLF
jgi:hypothetical protein